MKSKSLRIFIGSLQCGGAEKHLSYVLPGLVKKGWNIKIITTSTDNPLKKGLEGQGIIVKEPPHWVGLSIFNGKFLKPIRLFVTFYRFLLEFTLERKSLTHFFLPRIYGLGMLAAMMTCLKAPKLMSRRSLNSYQQKYKGFKQLEMYLHKQCEVILGNSQAVIDQLHKEEQVPYEKLKLIYNGIPLGGPEQSNEIRKSLGLSKSDIVMILVANLIPYKGHADLIDALGKYKSQLPPSWKLLCVGRDDGIKNSLEAQALNLQISENISWLGSRQDVPDLLRASDIGILCSHQEGFSNAILEGMAASLPMIVTDVGGNKEAVLDGKTGLVVKTRNPDALGQAIVSLTNNLKLAKEMGAEGRKRVEEHFSLEKCVQSYHDLYQTLG